MLPPLLQIGDFLVSTDIISECFACDYNVCKGACCIYGDSGAPYDVLRGLQSCSCSVVGEADALRNAYPQFSPYMSENGRMAVSSQSFSVVDRDGDAVTPLVSGTQECAFCHFDAEGNCLCSIQIASESNPHLAKPVSCSLYPIRLRRLCSGMIALNLHRWDICGCAFERGRREGIRVYEFLREPIIASFGTDLYDALDAARRQFCK